MENEELENEIERLKAEALSERDEMLNDNKSDGDKNDENIEEKDIGDEKEDIENHEEDDGDDFQEEDDSKNDEDIKEQSDSVEFEPIEITIGGQKINLESMEEVKQYLSNRNSEIEIKRENRYESMVKEARLSEEDIALLADIKSGKVGALKKLADANKIDLADADEFTGDYEAEFKVREKSEVDLVIDSIANNAELSPKFKTVIDSVPDEFLTAVTSNAQDLIAFAQHVNSGIAQELLPEATKASALNGKSLLENYINIGQEKYGNKDSKKTEKEADSKKVREVSEKERELRKRASDKKDQNKSGGSSSLTVDDIWNDDKFLEKVRNGEVNLRDLED